MMVYTIIVTYNGMQWIDRCLQSLRDSTLETIPIVVDNCSKDNTLEYVRANFPEVVLFPQEKNLGFGGANNIGIKYALDHDCDYIYLLNQDAWVDSNTIETLMNTHKANTEFGILSPMQTNAQKNKLDRSFAGAISLNHNILSDLAIGCCQDVYHVDAVMAAHWLISKVCLCKVGGFSPIFYHYGEDNDYVHRAVYYGFKIGVVLSVVGVHDREFRSPTLRSDLQLLEARFLHSVSNINRRLYRVVFKTYASLVYRTIGLFVKYRDFSILCKFATLLLVLPRIVNYRKYLETHEGAYLQSDNIEK